MDIKEMIDLFNKHTITSETNRQGKITYVSDHFVKISGYSREELIGQPHNMVRHPDMPKEAFKDMWETIQAGNVWKGEVKNLKKDLSYYWVDSVVFPLTDEHGEIKGFKSIRVNITDQKENEMLLNNLLGDKEVQL